MNTFAGEDNSSAQSRTEQYSFGRIARIWAAATLPMVALGWLAAPAFSSLFPGAAPVIYWSLMTAGMGWLCFLALRTLRREEGSLNWQTVALRIWLRSPHEPGKARRPVRRFLARSVTLAFCLLIAFVADCILLLILLAAHSVFVFKYPALRYVSSIWPNYANMLELVSPRYAAYWWLSAGIMGLWFISSLVAEELLFRGVLLPKMQGRFGKWDWAANGLLYAAFYVYQPWMIPVRLLDTLAVVVPVRAFRSLKMGLAIRGFSAAVICAGLWLALYEPPLKPLPVALDLPYISSEPVAVNYRVFKEFRAPLKAFPKFDPKNPWFSVDVKSRDLSLLDLRDSGEDLKHVCFDSLTLWPPKDKMPPDFDPAILLENGRNPGLGIRKLHEQGITGRGVAVAIVDNFLLTRHREYADRLMWYEEVATQTFGEQKRAQMHAPAVASLAVGKSVGVAPEADLYLIGMGEGLQRFPFYSHHIAQGIRRLLEINERLPESRRIRVISISHGTSPGMLGNDSLLRAVEEAEARGILVLVCGGAGQDHVRGLAVSPTADRDDFRSYSVTWIRGTDCLFVPMESRTTASPTGTEDYVFYSPGGASWTIPYVAGAYALAVQVQPRITPEKFWTLALKTGRYNSTEVNGSESTVGPILDMEVLIEALRSGE
jgi:hypothetical protein